MLKKLQILKASYFCSLLFHVSTFVCITFDIIRVIRIINYLVRVTRCFIMATSFLPSLVGNFCFRRHSFI